nr:glycoside hydrolase family 2 TIM barrel-domain containing protein [Kineococcus siccus]
MTNAVVAVGGEVVGENLGGYLPFSVELTGRTAVEGGDVLTVVVDSRSALNVPPNLPAPAPSSAIDYLQPGGLHRSVSLRVVPACFVRATALTHHDVLDPAARRTTAVVTLDCAEPLPDASLEVRVRDAAGRVLASTVSPSRTLPVGGSDVAVEVTGLQDAALWDTDDPVLHHVEVDLRAGGRLVHTTSVRTGYREARFTEDGFLLNGRRRYLLGVNRHGYFPFAGFSMPDRVHRRDAAIIKDELNCVMVRCSHYPQTASFLDACDELGLLVWEESPGWQYVGDSTWQDRAVDDIERMIARDRHRPSIVVWGARLNETPDRPAFYARTEALVKELDPGRTTSGTMFGDYARTATFQHDLFGYDDYSTAVDAAGERHPTLLEPVAGRPYLVSEAVSTRSSPTTFYLRTDGARVQQHQALDYALAHDAAMGDRRFCGLLAWVGFDYQANMGNHHRGVKTSGLGDVFRVLKPGAAIYRAQVDPRRRVVLEPAFTWDPPEFGQPGSFAGRPEHRTWGPGERAVLCSNCERLDVYLGDRFVGSVTPDTDRFPHLPHPPSFVDLRLQPADTPNLRVEGFVGGERVAVLRCSGDRAGDTLSLVADDRELVADGADATRVVVAVVDRFGRARGSSQALVHVEVDGPAVLVGDAVLDLHETGAVAAVWVRTRAGEAGTVVVRASAAGLGSEAVTLLTTTRS